MNQAFDVAIIGGGPAGSSAGTLLAKAGRRVVRLKTGEAFGPGRGGKDIAALREAGVTHFVVPGISADSGEVRPFSSSASSLRVARPGAGKTLTN